MICSHVIKELVTRKLKSVLQKRGGLFGQNTSTSLACAAAPRGKIQGLCHKRFCELSFWQIGTHFSRGTTSSHKKVHEPYGNLLGPPKRGPRPRSGSVNLRIFSKDYVPVWRKTRENSSAPGSVRSADKQEGPCIANAKLLPESQTTEAAFSP